MATGAIGPQRSRSARNGPRSIAAATVSGIPVTGDGDAIELAFRQQWRTRVDEVAGWSPEPWRDAVAIRGT